MVALAGTGVVLAKAAAGKDDHGGKPGPAAEETLEFAAVHAGVAEDEEFLLPISYDPAALTVDGRPAEVEDLVQVFMDPLLTVEAPDAFTQIAEGGLRVYPSTIGQQSFLDDVLVNVSDPGTWGFSSQYYIAEYRDPTTGEALAEPRITLFTVLPTVPSFGVTATVDGDGVARLSWDAVTGATGYWVVGFDARPDDWTESDVEIIGTTTSTTWSSEEAEGTDEWLGEGDDDVRGLQNPVFQAFEWSEDELAHPEEFEEYFEIEPGVDYSVPRAYGVIALTPQGRSSVSLLRDPSLEGRIPITPAWNALEELRAAAFEDFGEHPPLLTRYPVTMADGRTVLRTMLYDVAGIETGTGTTVLGDVVEVYYVPFRVEGTLLAGRELIDDVASLEEAQARAEEAVAAASAARPRTGALQSFRYSTEPVDTSYRELSTEMPEVPYPVNGSNPLTQYLAAHLILGSQQISLAGRLEASSTMTAGGIELADALEEATVQNPFILGWPSTSYSPDTQILYVDYDAFPDAQSRRDAQAALAAEVDRVTSQVVDPAMSEEEKVRAINTYLTSTAEYDFDALAALDAGTQDQFPRAWTAEGILIDKRGVCGSYAAAFAALADAADLEAVVVFGPITDGTLHAWNKVRIGESWLALDVTWNDTPAGDEFLLIDDAAMSETRTEGTEWVVDSRIADFATP